MTILGKLFGKDPSPPAGAASTPIDPAQDKNMIRVYDGYGRELFISRQEWRDSVLSANIQKAWNHPEHLASLIIQSFDDEFFEDMIKPAERLAEIDPNQERSTVLLSIVYSKVNRLQDAERVLTEHIAKHGESGVVLTNLAKIYSARGDEERSLQTLWHGLELDPNQDNGLGWYEVIFREKEGEAAGLEALRRIAALPGSWRARIWLGRAALDENHPDEALRLYEEAISMAPHPVPTDFLMQMSGDLGKRGYLPELLKMTAPHFDVTYHGLPVGNNLIKANLDLGQIDSAREILNQLYAQNRPDWKETLNFWDTEIAKAQVATSSVKQNAPLKMTLLNIDGPVWLNHSSPVAELFPAKPEGGPIITFLGSSAEIATNSKRVEHQLSDAAGRMSRALPLFLAEQIEFGTRARAQTLIPWIADEGGGFVLSGGAWSDETAATYASQSRSKSDYIVTVHLKTQSEPWNAELRLVRTIDGKCLGHFDVSFSSSKPEEAIPEFGRQLSLLLAAHAEVELQTPPPIYQTPGEAAFSHYLLRLEQLLAVRCSAMDGVHSSFLNGEREIVDGNVQLCLACPENVIPRILLVQTLSAMKNVRPDIIPEFKERVDLLQKEKPLSEPTHSVVQRVLNDVFAV